MSRIYSTAGTWKPEDQKVLYYSSWFVVDHKGTALFILLVSLLTAAAVWQREGSFFFALGALALLLVVVFRMFVPVRYEIDADGIGYRMLGRRHRIPWEEIRVYRIRHRGILLLPRQDRYPLEAFRGYFLPVPPALMTEVLYRFRVFVDRMDY